MSDPAGWREYVTSLSSRGAQEVAQLRRRCGQSFSVLRREKILACQFRLRATDPDLRHELTNREMCLVLEIPVLEYPDVPIKLYLTNEELSPRIRQQVH